MSSFKNAIALTGGIATGKSTVCNLLKLHGFFIIDADKIAHRVLDENYQEIENMFGSKYVENKKVLRKELGKIIFS
ncbi:MAG: dephospho-CoA kinase, partial [Arcobacter skirrowii]|nr:dephospho-CoA kinase [Aliarcobacter skirrowii]